jgi:uncharacterized membrane protein (UPF0127 family)
MAERFLPRLSNRIMGLPRRWQLLLGAAFAVAIAAVVVLLVSGSHRLAVEPLTIHTATGAYVFNVEIADRGRARSRGLMGRKELAANSGMLFLYGKPQEIRMWMKDTPLSLDMVFIEQDGAVHKIEKNAVPFSEITIYSDGALLACLELPGGTADRIGLAVGDRIEYRAFARPEGQALRTMPAGSGSAGLPL